MQDWEIKEAARQMNDMYEDLRNNHDFTGATASELVAAFFHGGYHKED